MSSKPKTSDRPALSSDTGASRKPQQGRSLASLERMQQAAEKLMLERGNEDFTLQDVSHAGNVSIGSIYLRFDGKDNLVRSVIATVLNRLDRDETAMIDEVVKAAPALADFVPRFVASFADVLRRHAPILRLTMQRAEHDPAVSGPGKASAHRSAARGAAAMMRYRAEIGGRKKELKAMSAYHIIFATLARELSLGSTGESASGNDWKALKRELATMCLAYLRHPD
jgi:AcrR family transcriptional regulator